MSELRRSHVALLTALAAMLAVSVLSSLYLLLVTEPAVVRYTNLARDARLMHEAMLDQETGLRGWVATDDAVFLDSYNDGHADVLVRSRDLVAETRDDATLGPLADRTVAAREDWQVWADDVVLGRTRLSSLTSGATVAVLLEGKTLFDAYRESYDVTNQAVVEQRDRALEAQRVALVLSMVAAVLTVAGAGAFAARRRRRLVRAVVEPVAEVLTTIDALRGGDLDARAPRTGLSELDAMGDALGHLAADLRYAGELAAAREERLELLADRLASVVMIAREVSGSTSVRYVAEAVTSAAAALLEAPTALWVRSDDGVLRAACRSTDEHGVVPPTDVPVPEEVATCAADARWVLAEGGRAHPLLLGGRVVGVLHVSGEVAEADVDSVDVLEALLSTAAAALESARLHSTAREQADHDALTQLPNRRRLEGDLAVEWERSCRYDRPLSVLMVDLDHFKRLNDEHGHLAGDAVLHAVAEALTQGLRSTDTAYRFGGEELVVLLRETDASDAVPIAERVRAAIADVVVPEVQARVTASIGLAQRTPGMSAAADMLEAADTALYTAKRTGRDRVAVAEPAPAPAAVVPAQRTSSPTPSPHPA